MIQYPSHMVHSCGSANGNQAVAQTVSKTIPAKKLFATAAGRGVTLKLCTYISDVIIYLTCQHIAMRNPYLTSAF